VSAFPTKALCSPRFADGADPELVTDPLFIAGLDISPEHLEESKAAVLREIERRRQVYSAAAWVSPNGRARARGDGDGGSLSVGTVVCVRDPEMKQAWCLAASRRGDGQGSDRPLRQSMRIESS
jgi:hypothetical protein